MQIIIYLPDGTSCTETCNTILMITILAIIYRINEEE
jgi:hypothetical protein